MRTMRRRRRRGSQAGFTLIELMISLVLFSFAVAGVLAVAVSMVNGFREQRLAFATEETARSAMNFMADALRGASPATTTGDISHTVICGNGALRVVNSSSAPDELYAVFASGSVVTTSTTALIDTSSQITVINAAEIAVGDTVLVTNFAKGHLVTVTSKAGNVLNISTIACKTGDAAFPTGGYAAGSVVVRAIRARFFVAPQDGISTLFMDPDAEGALAPEPLAEGIEDMQIAIAIDQDGAGISSIGAAADDDDWVYNRAGDTVPLAPIPAGTIRAVRITLIASATGKVTGVGTFLRPAAEDRPVSGVADNFRRRVLTSVIEVRNLGGSP